MGIATSNVHRRWISTNKHARNLSYVIDGKKVIKCSMKHVLHHNAIVTKLKYYCKQCNNVDVVQNAHSCFFLQFMGNSKQDIKQVRQLSGLAHVPTCRSAGQFVTGCSRLSSQSPGSKAVQCIIFLHFLALGANPLAKVHQRGDDLLPTQVYHLAKFHCPTSTHAGDIHYKMSVDKHGNTETVNDISPVCQSVRGMLSAWR